MHFPWKVRSTALQINSRLQKYFRTNTFISKCSPFEARCFEAQTCIFLACKFEDIHGHLQKIMHKVEAFSNNAYLSVILELEPEIFEFLDFDFNFANLYQSAFAVKLLMDEKDPNRILQWEYLTLQLNKVFSIANLADNLIEAVLAAFEANTTSDLNLNYNDKLVDEIRLASASVDFYLDQEIQEKCQQG